MGLKIGGSKKGRRGIAHKSKYLKQFSRTAKNKESARIRHLGKHPNDVKAKEDIKKARREV